VTILSALGAMDEAALQPDDGPGDVTSSMLAAGQLARR
jgi:hypothetical protein